MWLMKIQPLRKKNQKKKRRNNPFDMRTIQNRMRKAHPVFLCDKLLIM